MPPPPVSPPPAAPPPPRPPPPPPRAPLSAWLHVLRAGALFSPAADVVAGLALAGHAWDVTAVRTVLAGVCLYAAGMVLNDHADRRDDAVHRPERPIQRGEVRPAHALVTGMLLLAAALALSPMPIWHAAMAALVLAYDYVLKRRVELGAVAMGALRGLNLAAGAVVPLHALHGLHASREVVIAAVCYGVYILAVTVLGTLEDEPKPRPRAVLSVQLVPPLVAALALLGMPQPYPAAWLGFALAAAFLLRVRRQHPAWDAVTIRASMRWLLLGTMLYTALLCWTAGRVYEAAAIAAVVPLARAISRRIAMT